MAIFNIRSAKTFVTSFFDNHRRKLEMILTNFVFLRFLIFDVQITHFVTQENKVITVKQPSLPMKNRKKCPFNEEKSLVGLTPQIQK